MSIKTKIISILGLDEEIERIVDKRISALKNSDQISRSIGEAFRQLLNGEGQYDFMTEEDQRTEVNSNKTISWADVLQTRTRTVDLDSLGNMARRLGYPYIVWNDRVYRLTENSISFNLDLTDINIHSIQ